MAKTGTVNIKEQARKVKKQKSKAKKKGNK